MSKNKLRPAILLVVLLLSATLMNAQQATSVNQALTNQQQSVVIISALTATGDLDALKRQLNIGLEAGLFRSSLEYLSLFVLPKQS